jgi:hypothetical protein
MSRTANTPGYSHWYLFLLSPFLTAILAVWSYKASWAKNIIWAFIVFFGFTFGTASESSTGSKTSDVFRYTNELAEMHKKNLTFPQIQKLYKNNDDIDILRLTLAIGVSRFTDSSKILLGIYGLIFGFFFSRNIWFVLERLEGVIKPLTILLLIVFFLINPIWNINGFRFYTATNVFIYGLLPYFFEKKKKGLFISLFSFLIHFSFIIPIGVLLLYLLAGNRPLIYFALFIASIVTSEIDIKSVNTWVDANAPKAMSERTSGYRSEDEVKRFRQGAQSKEQPVNWYATFYFKALNWSVMAFLIYLFFKRKVLLQLNPRFLNMLSFSLLIWTLANIMSSLPSGIRFSTVAALTTFPLIVFYVHYNYREKNLKQIARYLVPLLLLFVIVSIRNGFYFLSINTFLGNPVIALFADYIFPLNDLIK